MVRRKHLLFGALALLVIIQLIRPDYTAPKAHAAADLGAVLQVPPEIDVLLKEACYDCHSYHTHYPWYGQIAPISWWIAHHVEEGREHINFSTFGHIPAHEQLLVLKECSEVVLDGEMPLRSYTWMHPEARLSPAQRQLLAEWFSAQTHYNGGEEEQRSR